VVAVYTPLSPSALAAAAAAFGLPPPDRAVPELRGYVNTSYHLWVGERRFFLRVNEGKDEADVLFEARVQRFLSEAGFPVPALQPASDGRPYALVEGKPACLFTHAAGEPTPELGPARCRWAGEVLGRLHALAEGFGGGRENPYDAARVAAWLAPRDTAPGAEEPAEAVEVEAALPLLEAALAQAGALPAAPAGLVHGDPFPDNVLWTGERISAVLDWEMSCVAPFAYDLGVALCAWCWRGTPPPAGFDAARARALLAGYAAVRPLEPGTMSALPAWTRFAALRFTASRLDVARRPAPAPERASLVVRKDWREFRDRLAALRELGDAGILSLAGI
jgi:homoserine kinase type II